MVSFKTQKWLIAIILIVTLVLCAVSFGLSVNYYNTTTTAVKANEKTTTILETIIVGY